MTYLRDSKGRFRTGRFMAWSVIGCGLVLGLSTLISVATASTTTVYVKETVKDTSPTPILVKIANCESGNSQVDKNGQVLVNSTYDLGKYQINVRIWGAKATELGLNLAVEKDNEAMARWLYENKGTGVWSASSKCWSK